MGRLTALLPLTLLPACAPLQAPPPVLPYPGGFVQGGLVTGRFQVALPGPPLFLDADASSLYAAYPYQLLVYRDGQWESLPLPGVPQFLRASGGKGVVGLGEAVYAEGNLLPYPARDGVWTQEGLFWVGKSGLFREGELLRQGAFQQVVVWEKRVVALGEEAYFYPDGQRLPLPHPARKAQAGSCGVVALMGNRVYVVRPEGAKPVAEAQDVAAWEETLYLVPGMRTASCKEVVWP
ncbi:hypothetical protein [Thermus caldifontis]|uniref:hypothetical protein n=1 Tax=Thermus caldifontis TaxID=1930763 RepID=UPI000DF35B75|nr:hypothetical protein [Thermus caldifontis]